MALIEDNYGNLNNISKDSIRYIGNIRLYEYRDEYYYYYFYIYYFYKDGFTEFKFQIKDYKDKEMTKRQCENLRQAMIDAMLDVNEKIIKPLTTINLKK